MYDPRDYHSITLPRHDVRQTRKQCHLEDHFARNGRSLRASTEKMNYCNRSPDFVTWGNGKIIAYNNFFMRSRDSFPADATPEPFAWLYKKVLNHDNPDRQCWSACAFGLAAKCDGDLSRSEMVCGVWQSPQLIANSAQGAQDADARSGCA